MSKLKNIQEVNRKFEERFLMYEQPSAKMRTCMVGESGTLVKTMNNGKSVFGLSKSKDSKGVFCYVPDSSSIERTTTPLA